MATLKEWDGRAKCSIALADSYYASECVVPLNFNGTLIGLHFVKGSTDEATAQRKEIALTYAEASSLADGRFTVSKIESDAPSDESKTDRARKKAAAANVTESEG